MKETKEMDNTKDKETIVKEKDTKEKEDGMGDGRGNCSCS